LHGVIAASVAIGGALSGVLVDGVPWWTAVVGPLGGALWFAVAMRHWLRRRRMVKTPFPDRWRQMLFACVPYYNKIPASERERFENDVRFFLAEQRIYGLKGAPVEDRVKVLVAASAAILSHGLPDWEWPTLRDIVIYPNAFDEDYDIGQGKQIIGMVHHQGPIVFSEKDLKHGFCYSRDGLNVGLHELAHVMDMRDGRADGIPDGMQWAATAPWLELMADRLVKLRSRRGQRALRRYAGKNEAEFFAVAVEVFFEQPEKLHDMDPELYGLLAEYFNQDPAKALVES
jgi:hypothetical protein